MAIDKMDFECDWEETERKEKEMDSSKSGGFNKDTRLYIIKPNSEGKFNATIRFMPPKKGEAVARLPISSHSFKRKGWYFENCPKQIGKKCPVCDRTYEVYSEYGKEAAKIKNAKMYPKKQYVSNIYVISDEQNPENEGKIFLWAYGVTIKNIIEDAIKPEDEEQSPIKPFSFNYGADFRIQVYTKKTDDGNMPQYDKCKFRKQSEFLDGDTEQWTDIQGKLYSLEEFNDPKNFLSYDELKEKLDRALSGDSVSDDDDNEDDKPKSKKKSHSDEDDDDFDEKPKKSKNDDDDDFDDKPKSKKKVDEDDDDFDDKPKKTKSEDKPKQKAKVDEDVEFNEVDEEDDFFAKMKED